MILDDRGVDLLIEAIILNAIKDYKFALKWKDVVPETEYQVIKVNSAKMLYSNVRTFFHTKWYKSMCKIDGEKILNHLEEEYRRKGEKRIRRKAAQML
jgi:hypothetical protein